MEPPDTEDTPLDIVSCLNPIHQNKSKNPNSNGVEDIRHPSTVPAAGRGNSEDGRSWINPSANQLLNACKRKNKNMEEKDKGSVALIHGEVIEKTWNAVLQYEQLHYRTCDCPKLSSFEGMHGKPSFKAKILNKLGYPLPWDRHDWYVDRCGKQIRYIIDYHHGLQSDQPYILDCRPDLKRFSNIMDRLTIQYRAFKYTRFARKNETQQSETKPQFLTDLFEKKH
eukprot:230646_1